MLLKLNCTCTIEKKGAQYISFKFIIELHIGIWIIKISHRKSYDWSWMIQQKKLRIIKSKDFVEINLKKILINSWRFKVLTVLTDKH